MPVAIQSKSVKTYVRPQILANRYRPFSHGIDTEIPVSPEDFRRFRDASLAARSPFKAGPLEWSNHIES